MKHFCMLLLNILIDINCLHYYGLTNWLTRDLLVDAFVKEGSLFICLSRLRKSPIIFLCSMFQFYFLYYCIPSLERR